MQSSMHETEHKLLEQNGSNAQKGVDRQQNGAEEEDEKSDNVAYENMDATIYNTEDMDISWGTSNGTYIMLTTNVTQAAKDMDAK